MKLSQIKFNRFSIKKHQMGCFFSTPKKNPNISNKTIPLNDNSNYTGDSNNNSSYSPSPIIDTSYPNSNSSSKLVIKAAEFEPGEQGVKVLMLGAGECGKTTIWRQIKISKFGGFSEDEKMANASAIKISLIGDIKVMVDYLKSSGHNLPDYLSQNIDTINDLNVIDDELTPEIADVIDELWQNPVFNTTIYEEVFNSSVGIGEYASFFFDNVKRIAETDYLPTNEDLLKVRFRTTGINTMTFSIDNRTSNNLNENKTVKATLVDVGGQQSERRKWGQLFKNVSYLMFVVSLSDFDQKCFEESDLSRTEDSLKLFESIVNTEVFKNTPFFLVLNKKDLFIQKLKAKPEEFKKTYPNFTGNVANYAECFEHVKNEFLKRAGERAQGAEIVACEACAMEEASISELFEMVTERIASPKC
ncbi:Guanine nucleotide-binding protein subunit alpha [Tritrichomonas foetus]|uniref:Guanine nucleotide-binding protein subunit alpha n=1 Tax=Tritrichomonas foetus TaxID=1144522 RepID=A0A1J4KXT9_9EUKA|nr:Guanine nucleotide-binding protein subunit alpha [Tritrichomonas foetus]|eukprot:OHT14518.1 Guanine nucleotide-binding protein subunit alpha [Tritrichomonas foetus]